MLGKRYIDEYGDVPDWVQAPDPGSINTGALSELTNPETGETWTAPSGGYSVKPSTNPWDGSVRPGVLPDGPQLGFGGESKPRPVLDTNPGTGGMSRFAPLVPSLGPGSIIEKTPKNPDFEGIDMSGFVPPRMQTMDVQTFTLNGEERTGSSSYISALESYLNSTGQGDVFSRGNQNDMSTEVGGLDFGQPVATPDRGTPVIEGRPYRGPVPVQDDMTSATEPTNPFAGIPVWSGDTPNAPWNQQPEFTQTPYQQPMLTGDSGIANLAYSGSQLGAPQQKGLARQNLDYAMAQLGMMTGGTGTGDTGTGGISTPGFDAPWGGATPDGGYTNPFTGTDSAGRTPDDPYYGGLSDVGTADPNNWTYGNVNDYYNWGGDVLGGLFGPIAGAFGDAAFGINPIPGAGNYIPGTDTYIPTYLENFEGAGEKITDLYGIGTSEQRDMLIDQGFLGGEGMLGNKVADPDQQFFETKAEALQWYNNGVPVANPGHPGTAEAVGVANDMLSLQGSSFGSQAEAQAVANYGFGSDEHMAAIESQLNDFKGMTNNLENIPELDFIYHASLAQKAESNLNSIRNDKISKARDADIFNKFKGYTDKQITSVNKGLDENIANINKTLDTNKDLNQEQRDILKDALYTMTSDKIGLINTQLEGIKDTNSKQYDDLLNQLETVEGNLITQINDSYTGPNTGYNPITDDAPDTGGTSPEDLGGTGTTVDDALDEITSGYDDPSESTGPSVTPSPSVDTPESTGLSDIGVGDTGSVSDSSGLSADVTNLGDGQYSIDMGEGEDAIGYEAPPSDSGSDSSSSSGGCFVTTATLQEVDTKDDGKELTTFRDFRDNYLKNKSYGPALVRDYYNTAPNVVAEIDSRENYKQLYKDIWKEHLRPINRLIEKGDNAEATSKYMLMMEELKERFLPSKGEM